MPTKTIAPLLLTGLICALFGAPAARAADHEGADRRADDVPDEYHWGLGIGVGVHRSTYKGETNKTSLIPLLSYENQYVRFFGNTLDAKLPSAGEFDFSLRTKVSIGDGYKGSDSNELAGMETRKGSFFFGGATTWRTPYAKLSLEYLHAAGVSKGATLTLGAEHSFKLDRRFELTPHVSVERVDAKYVDYYYGVRPGEATSSRAAYAGTATTNTEIGLRLGYAIDARQRLLLDVADKHLGTGITNSPLVQRTSSPALKIGYIYRF